MRKWDAPPTVSRSYLADHTYSVLRAAILSGELAPGTSLREIEIATRVGVSRTPVREALRRLQLEGLATKLRNGSLAVSEITVQIIKEAFAMRELLEGYAASEAARVATPDDVTNIQAIIDEAQQAVTEGASEQLPLLNDRFHGYIEDLARNSLLKKATHLLREQTVVYHAFALGKPAQQQAFVDDHKAILAALAARDPEQARAVAVHHLEVVMKLILAKPGEEQTEP